ncbi:hypothetical protein [Paracoccus cavernae]|uniref:hypothetical protein n=1 Tax=Paracoccus cavernae TaxID=1571207 RepID=UPI003638C7C1
MQQPAAGQGAQRQPLQVRPAQPQPPAQKRPGAAVPARQGQGQAVARPIAPSQQAVRQPVSAAQPQKRHWMLLLSFLIIVVVPTLISAWYLWNRAADQYVSTVGFSVRKEDSAAPSFDFLGGLAALSGGTVGASDTDILYQYIRSHDMVETADQKLDLRTMFSRDWPRDFVFAYNPTGTIEDLTDYWQRQVKIYYDRPPA